MDYKEFCDLSKDERRVHLDAWRQDRLTYKDIAKMLGTTRNTIAGLVYRLDVAKLTPEEISVRQKPKKPPKERSVSTIPDIKVKIFKPSKPVPEKTELWQALPGTTPIRLLPAEKGQCRWPIGHRTHTVCGQPTAEGSSWCPTHHAIVFLPAPKEKWSHGRT